MKCKFVHSQKMFCRRLATLSLGILLCALTGAINGEYLIGVGSYDMTGPASEINMMGYANIEQTTAGIHFRLRARAFIISESGQGGARFAFVNLDAGMASQLVTIKVLERLKSRYGDLYTKENVAISGTHTHAGPGGYLQYLLYSVTTLGFVQQSFDAIVNAIEQSIVRAHQNLKPGTIFMNKGDVENAGINRSPSAYQQNPEEERGRYDSDVDKEMTLLKFVDGGSGRSIGAFSWHATHGTSMSKNNKLISGDNKGAAARSFEDWFTSNAKANSTIAYSSKTPDIGKLIAKAQAIKSTGGQPCDRTTSQSFKVRRNSDSLFVGAFCQSNVGDVTPNVLGAFCSDTGQPCDFNRSSCHGDETLCLGRGPGYPDEILSTKIIGERQFSKAVDLFTSAKEILSGKIDYRQVYLNFTDIEVELDGNQVVKTCPAALGPGFAAGTTDGPGVFGFQQGDTEINRLWKQMRDVLKEPSPYQVECQKPKPVLLSTGEMDFPYAWAVSPSSPAFHHFSRPETKILTGVFVVQPAVLPIQILRLGQLVILSVPGEFTTMAGRRLREAVQETLASDGGGEFNSNTHVVIAGLTNTYSQYIATFEEYGHLRYEASSTLYGPHTLSAYIQEFRKLASAMAKGEIIGSDLSPPDLSPKQLKLVLDPLGEPPLPHGINIGDLKQDVSQPRNGSFTKGDTVSATFFSGNPRNDLFTEGTFAVVEKLLQEGRRWVPVYDDDDLCSYFKWSLDYNFTTFSNLATIEWEVPEEASSGVYRLRHFGSTKKSQNATLEYFTGSSSAFTVA